MNWESLIINIATGIFAIAVAYINKLNTRNSNKEIDLLKIMVAECKNENQILKDKSKESDTGHKFRMDIKNSITEKAVMKINETENLKEDDAIVSALVDYFKDISEFALMFFYSGLRKNDNFSESDFYDHLETSLKPNMYKFTNILKNEIKKTKEFKHGNSLIEISFMEIFGTDKDNERKEPDCFSINKLLIMQLSKNNISEIDLKRIFIKYTGDFMDMFKTKYTNFHKLKDYNID